jgi:hypothetical protein
MANTGAIRAGRAFVELFADDTKLVRGLRAASAKLKAFGASISGMGRQMVGLGAALAAPLAASAKAFAKIGGDIDDMSRRTGISTESLSAMGWAAQLAGSTLEDFEKSARKMQRTITDASMGMKSAQDALGALGLSYQQLSSLSPEEQFMLIADRLSKIKDPTQRAAMAMMVFGRSGTAMLPMLEKGAAGIKAWMDEAKQMGLVISTESAVAAGQFADSLDRVWAVVKMTAFQIGAALAPAMTKLSGIIKDVIVQFNAWVQQNRQVVVMVAKVVAGIIAGGIALMLLGGIISGLGAAIGGLASTIVFVGTVFKVLGAAIMFLTQPIVLVIAAVAALGAYLIYASGAGAKALEWLGSKFQTLKEDAMATWGGIGDALAAGDMALAAKILWLTLKMEWIRGTNFLQKLWLDFSGIFIKLAYDAFYGALAAATYAWYGIQIGWAETVAFLKNVWNSFSSGFAKSWEWMQAIAQKAMLFIMSLFDDRLDLDAAYKVVDENKEAAYAKIDADKANQAKAIEDQRKSRTSAAEQQKDAEMEAIGTMYNDTNKKREDKYNQEMSDNASELEKARQEWKDSLGAAKSKRAEKDNLDKMAKPGEAPTAPDLSGLTGKMDEVAKMTSAGGFSGFTRFGAEGGSAADRTANATEKMSKDLHEMLQLQREEGAV